MDHLLRNRRLGSLATRSPTLFLCPYQFTFYTDFHNATAVRLGIGDVRRRVFLGGGSKREQHQYRASTLVMMCRD